LILRAKAVWLGDREVEVTAAGGTVTVKTPSAT
jgi:hypothetical protein